jgi:hypothetical protein
VDITLVSANHRFSVLSYEEFRDIEQHVAVFEDVVVTGQRGVTLNHNGVGVAEDIRIGGLYEPPEMYVYVPYSQDAQGFGLLLVEAAVDPASIVPR